MCLPRQPRVKIDGTRAQARTLGDPVRGIILELDLASIRVCPVTGDHLGLDKRQCTLSVRPALVGLRPGAHPPVRAGIADLVPARLTPCGCCRTFCAGVCSPSRSLPGSGPNVSYRHRLDDTGCDELPQCGLGDTDETANPHKANPPLGNKPPGESLAGAEQLRCLGDSEQPVSRLRSWCITPSGGWGSGQVIAADVAGVRGRGRLSRARAECRWRGCRRVRRRPRCAGSGRWFRRGAGPRDRVRLRGGAWPRRCSVRAVRSCPKVTE